MKNITLLVKQSLNKKHIALLLAGVLLFVQVSHTQWPYLAKEYVVLFFIQLYFLTTYVIVPKVIAPKLNSQAKKR